MMFINLFFKKVNLLRKLILFTQHAFLLCISTWGKKDTILFLQLEKEKLN